MTKMHFLYFRLPQTMEIAVFVGSQRLLSLHQLKHRFRSAVNLEVLIFISHFFASPLPFHRRGRSSVIIGIPLRESPQPFPDPNLRSKSKVPLQRLGVRIGHRHISRLIFSKLNAILKSQSCRHYKGWKNPCSLFVMNPVCEIGADQADEFLSRILRDKSDHDFFQIFLFVPLLMKHLPDSPFIHKLIVGI